MKKWFATIILFFLIIGNGICQSPSKIGKFERLGDIRFFSMDGERFELNTKTITVKLKPKQFLGSIEKNQIRSNILGFIDLSVPQNEDVEDYIAKLEKTGKFESVEYNHYGKYSVSPNDNYYSNQWYLSRIGVDNAWEFSMGNTDVVVAVLDSGLDWMHPDIGYGSDSYHNIDITNAWNYITNSSNIITTNFHGTFVTGIVSAKSNNTIGICGIAGGNYSNGVEILPICIGINAPDASVIDDAIIYAVDNGAKVIQLSLSVASTTAITSAINYAITHNVVIVCSSGNDNSSQISYPASNPNVIAVGATNIYDQRAYFSNYGNGLELVAPGTDIYSTTLGSSYAYYDGTSFSSPQVSGVIALMLSVNPALSISEIREILQTTSVKLPSYTFDSSGWNSQVGYGLISANNAVLQAIVRNLSISGPEVVCDSAVYFIENLPQNFNVEWSYPPTTDPLPIMISSYPSENSCMIVNRYRYPYEATLTATIKKNNIVITTLSKRTISDYVGFSGTYYQEACTYYNVNHPEITERPLLSTGGPKFVHMGCTVVLKSNDFKKYPITYSGITPSLWEVDTTEGTVSFQLPLGTGGIPFSVSMGRCFNNGFLFFPIGNNGNMPSQQSLSITQNGNIFYFTVIENNEKVSTIPTECQEMINNEDSRGNNNNLTEKGTIVIYNGYTGKKKTTGLLSDMKYRLDATGWEPGIYVVRITIGNEVFVEKIQIH